MAPPSTAPDPNPWIYAGLVSSFPDITPTLPKHRIAKPPPDPWDPVDPDEPPPPCKIIQLADLLNPKPQTLVQAQLYVGWDPQVMIFRYKGRMHAIDHACPHRAAPLSRGHLVDLEDFGNEEEGKVGVMCPKHEWKFDLMSGRTRMSKGVKLGVWDVEVKGSEQGKEEGDREIWVRRRVEI